MGLPPCTMGKTAEQTMSESLDSKPAERLVRHDEELLRIFHEENVIAGS